MSDSAAADIQHEQRFPAVASVWRNAAFSVG